ncbi:TerB family tellurite resistance protein [Roseospira visakhapatnamensis]|uniref:Putative tellurite resistance protein B-like protein n=1 Tax=Roseospira visakhapatnamensis TaxID=390880 RepID=A0A7W6WA07_9PROT|nr:TerB family tellurite resistance protein [Roseospira visakhapatnamensis]MBB4266705.1 putative tellurite resistance protein B-like protein [Roseospira visakhapatnamensis]
MLDSLKKILFGDEQKPDVSPEHEVQFAVAVLLAEAATMDGAIDDAETKRIRELLVTHFGLSLAEAAQLMGEADAALANRVELYGPSRVLKDALDYPQRIELIEMLWDVVYADGVVHDYEANLMRRLGGLLFVDDQDSGTARKRVLERRGLA